MWKSQSSNVFIAFIFITVVTKPGLSKFDDYLSEIFLDDEKDTQTKTTDLTTKSITDTEIVATTDSVVEGTILTTDISIITPIFTTDSSIESTDSINTNIISTTTENMSTKGLTTDENVVEGISESTERSKSTVIKTTASLTTPTSDTNRSSTDTTTNKTALEVQYESCMKEFTKCLKISAFYGKSVCAVSGTGKLKTFTDFCEMHYVNCKSINKTMSDTKPYRRLKELQFHYLSDGSCHVARARTSTDKISIDDLTRFE